MRGWAVVLGWVAMAAGLAQAAEEPGFVSLWDGKTFEGWRASENTESWQIIDGALVCKGPRSHLYYVGEVANHDFKNFHFKVEVMTESKSNSGIYFHTKWQEKDWPKVGYEAQVNNAGGDPQKTGSLYGVEKVAESAAKDGEWYTQEVIVKGNHVTIKVAGKTVVDYEQPENPEREPAWVGRRLSSGTFAFQAHDPQSVVHFKNPRVKVLD